MNCIVTLLRSRIHFSVLGPILYSLSFFLSCSIPPCLIFSQFLIAPRFWTFKGARKLQLQNDVKWNKWKPYKEISVHKYQCKQNRYANESENRFQFQKEGGKLDNTHSISSHKIQANSPSSCWDHENKSSTLVSFRI